MPFGYKVIAAPVVVHTCCRSTISQSTPKEGPDYADTIFGSYEEDDLTMAIHERLKAHARPWQPPS